MVYDDLFFFFFFFWFIFKARRIFNESKMVSLYNFTNWTLYANMGFFFLNTLCRYFFIILNKFSNFIILPRTLFSRFIASHREIRTPTWSRFSKPMHFVPYAGHLFQNIFAARAVNIYVYNVKQVLEPRSDHLHTYNMLLFNKSFIII